MNEDMIMAEDYAKGTHTDITFINQLREYGLIEITIQQQVQYIPSRQLPLLEKYSRLHYDMDINMEGIEAIAHLLERIEAMQNELGNLKRRVQLYQSSD